MCQCDLTKMDIFEELGIPKKYLKKLKEDRFIALVHNSWLKSLVKHLTLTDFIEKPCLESWPVSNEEVGLAWSKIFVSVFKKKDLKVIPLPRIRPFSKDESTLLFPQLMQYISQTNYKNLWREAYKKYSPNADVSKETQVTLCNYNDVLRETIVRIYGCPVVNVCDPDTSTGLCEQFSPNCNVLPAVCAVETMNFIFLLHCPYFDHNLSECLTFSPAILEKYFTKPQFLVYQLLNLLKSLHDRSLTLGDITLDDIYLTEDMWIQVFPQVSSNIYIQSAHSQGDAKNSTIQDCRKVGHTFNDSLKCEYCGIRTYDKVQTSNENLDKMSQLWVDGQISNFTYIMALNKFSGRKFGDPNCHYVLPWVTDFAAPCGKNWRDLKKSKYRLNKGDRQLDLTYSNSQISHHVSDVLSPITYYVYMARRTPRSVLCKNVRTVWVPAEYPSSIQRMQEWTPDECIPEFYSDPSIFNSIHDDLEDLDVPPWCSGPEDFIERHREVLEGSHVSERLHHWIDLTFGYKLGGNAAVKAKNVCLHIADEHEFLTKSGLVQLFSYPHPPKAVSSPFWNKVPPRIYMSKPVRQRSREQRSSSAVLPQETSRSDEDEHVLDDLSTSASNLGVSKMLSRSRSSLQEDSKPNRSPSNQRTSKTNPTFTSHVKTKANTLSTGTIYLPKEYRPEQALECLEKRYAFFSRTFHSEQSQASGDEADNGGAVSEDRSEQRVVHNGFTNIVFSERYREKFRGKSRNVNQDVYFQRYNRQSLNQKTENQIVCNYASIISSRRIRELQVLGCLIMEIFMSRQLRCLNISNVGFNKRLRSCLKLLKATDVSVPPCISYVVNLLLQPEKDLKNFSYPSVTDLGLPQPSAHLLLEPLLHCIIPFPKHFRDLYALIYSLKEFRNAMIELNILYHFDCNGERCSEYENLERRKVLFAQNISECKVKSCVRDLEALLDKININTNEEMVNILVPHVKELLEEPPTSVLAAWYLFEKISRVLGPSKSSEYLLESILKLYENEPNDMYLPYMNKIAKLYHHSFLLRLMIRLGLRCFLENFVVPLVEAVGGYKDYERIEFIPHNHSEKSMKRASNLRDMNIANDSTADDRSNAKVEDAGDEAEEDFFEFEDEKENEEQLKSLMEQLELNIASDLPFNHSTAEEALDATLSENIEQLRNLEELQLGEDLLTNPTGVVSPTISIPSGRRGVVNISCEIGSKKSEGDPFLDNKSQSINSQELDAKSFGSQEFVRESTHDRSRNNDTKISEMSSDSLIWLSHRLGPVLTAKYLSRNLLKMLTLCYIGPDNLSSTREQWSAEVPLAFNSVVGDRNAHQVLECLTSIAALYGEQIIVSQYIPHMSELILLCKRRLTPNLEGGLISCLALLKYIVPYLSDGMLMDQLPDVILRNIIHPLVKFLGSNKYRFPNGNISRNALARKYLDALYVLSIRIGSDMTKKYLVESALPKFFLIFSKVYEDEKIEDEKVLSDSELSKSIEESHYVEYLRDGTTAEWKIGAGKPIRVPHVEDLKESDLEEDTARQALEELRAVFTPELAHTAYLPFLKHLGSNCLEIHLENHALIRSLCQEYEKENPKLSDFIRDKSLSTSGSIGSNIALIGNRIDIHKEDSHTDILSLVSSRMENTSRHLRGNWLAYWEHEIGRSEKDTMFNFKQIKLQTFQGHANSVKCLHVLDNENSFMSGGRDKTVKLWSLRSHGDSGSSGCQWTYGGHKKAVLSLAFSESVRLVASCDSVVHIWDPFMGSNLCNLESSRYSPVNVLRCAPAPSTYIFAATTDGTVKVIDTRTLSYVYELKISINPSGLIRCLAVAPSGAWVAAGQSSGAITILDTRTGLVLASWRAHEGEVLQLVTIDDRTLVSSSLDQNVTVWNVSDGKFKHSVKGATEPVHCLNVYANVELISGTTANRIGVHTSVDSNASFSSTKLRSDAFKGLLTSMALLPLNRLLLLGADTGNINLLC